MDPYELIVFITHVSEKRIPTPRLPQPAIVTYESVTLSALISMLVISLKTGIEYNFAEQNFLPLLDMLLWLLM